MTDRLTPAQRKKNMQHVKNKDTEIEMLLRKSLWKKGIRFRINNTDILGKPDICIRKYKLLVFCDGDFWHGKDFSSDTVDTNKKFWTDKIRTNQERDFQQTMQLRDDGWTVLRFWGSDIKKDVSAVVEEIINTIKKEKERKGQQRIMKLEFKNEFERRFASNLWDDLRLGGANCPDKDSYDLYKACFLQTVSEMKRLGYRIPKAYKMPTTAVKRAKEILYEMSKTWEIIY